MNTTLLKQLLAVFTAFLILLLGIYYKFSCENKANRCYKQGLKLYEQEKYSDAYYNFKQIKSFSKKYKLALLKQYQCADKLQDKKTSLIKLKELSKISNNEYIKPWALYQEAILSQELNLLSQGQLNRKFKFIQKNYPNNDFGIASAYKSAQLSKNTTPNLAKESYINYLSYAPLGKFSLSALDELSKINCVFSKEDYEIIAEAKLANNLYQNALEDYQKTSFSKNWFKISKCYRGLKEYEKEKQIILKGLDLKSSEVDEKDINIALDRLISITKANKSDILQELYTKFQDSYALPTIAYNLAETSNSIRAIRLYEFVSDKYPNSIWASNSLWEIFWYNYKENRFQNCEKIAKKHIATYADTQDAPRISYWYGKALLKMHKNQQAREIFFKTIKTYPMSYYAFMSARQLKMSKSKKMMVKKQITSYNLDNLNKLIFEDKTLLELANANDWELIDNFKIDNEYIKSWIAYKKENPALAINIAKKELLDKKDENIDTQNKKENKNYFSNQMLKMVYPIFYEEEINYYANKKNQSAYLFLSLIREESHFNKDAKSSVGAMGLTQLMQGTADYVEKTKVSKETLANPSENIRMGMDYFEYLMNIFNKNEYLSILAYNAGPGNIKKWLNDSTIKSDEIDEFVENIPFLETKNYIKKILSSYWIYLNIYSPKNK